MQHLPRTKVWRCSLCDFETMGLDFRPLVVQVAEHISSCSATQLVSKEGEICPEEPFSQLTTLYQGSLEQGGAAKWTSSKAYDWEWIAVRDDRPRNCWQKGTEANNTDDTTKKRPWAHCAALATLPLVDAYPRDDFYALDFTHLLAAHASARQLDRETRSRCTFYFQKQSAIYSKGHVASGLFGALQKMGYTELEAGTRALSMFSEMFVLAVSGRKSDTLACYKGAGAIASVLLADYVGSIENGEIQALAAYTAVVARSDYIPAPKSEFLSNVIAHDTQWISDGKALSARGDESKTGQLLSIDEYMRPRWPDGACDAYVGITMYSKAIARGHDSVGRFVQSLGQPCAWAQAMHDVVFYYNDITDVISDIALGEPMNLFVQARDVSKEHLVWLATAMATLDYVASQNCRGCLYHSDSEDWHYGSCVWYLAATRYCTAPQLWSVWADGDIAPRWHELKWRSFAKGWPASRWPFSDVWQITDSIVNHDIVEHLALRLGLHDPSAKNEIKAVVEGNSTVPEMIRHFIVLALPQNKYVQCIQDTVLQCLRAHGYGTGSYTLSQARSDAVAYNLGHSSLLDRLYEDLNATERCKAIRVYCGLVSAICELTDLDVYGRIAAFSAAALARPEACMG